MQLKVFHIRINKENFDENQKHINLFMNSVNVHKINSQFVNDSINFWSILVYYSVKVKKDEQDKISYTDEIELNDAEEWIYNALKKWRYEKSVELHLPPFIICSNTELISISKVKPNSLQELIKVKGFGEKKIAKFGSDIIALLNSL